MFEVVENGELLVAVRCQVCSELRTFSFSPYFLEDEAFAKEYPKQPWAIPCHECEQLMRAHTVDSDEFNEFFALREGCMAEAEWAISRVRSLIQKS